MTYKRVWILILLLQLLIGGATAARSAEVHEVPLRFYGTRPAVEVRVNGQGPFLFLVDTGAGGPPARADASLVQRLSIARLGRTESADAGGSAAAIDQVRLQTVEIAGLTFTGVDALSRDYGAQSYLPKIDGILGLEFFREWLLTIDYGRGSLRLEKGELAKVDGASILALELIDGNPYVAARIGKLPIKLLLDTGNIRALDLPSSSLRTLRLASFPRHAGNSSSVSGTVPLREVQLADALVIGELVFPKPEVTFADDFKEANLGSTLLQDTVVTVDLRNRRVSLVRSRR